MLQLTSSISSILPSLSKPTRKEVAMSNKPKPRILGAEPLEERLPVSASITGVLFGLGLAQLSRGWSEA